MVKKVENKEKNKGGRPPKYSNAKTMQAKIDEYFKNCPDFVELQAFDKSSGEFVTYKKLTPTMCGLGLFLGFSARSAFYEYENKPKFTDTIKRARLRIENEYEKQLYNDKCTGAIFALKNLGWKDKQETEVTATVSTQETYLKHLENMSNAD